MGAVERIQLRKIYLSSAVNFGLVFGLFVGFLTFVFLSVLEFTGYSVFSSSGLSGYAFAGLFGLVYFAVFFIAVFVFCMLYNLSVKIGGRIDFGLAEHVTRKDTVVDEKKVEDRMEKVNELPVNKRPEISH